MKTKQKRQIAIGVLALSLATGAFWRTRTGGLTAQFRQSDAMERTRTLYERLEGGAQEMEFVSHYLTQPAASSQEKQDNFVWLMDCLNREGDCRAVFTWDAQKGTLLKIVFYREGRFVPDKIALSAEEAKSAALAWIEKLGVAEPNVAWKLAERPRRVDAWWNLTWSAEGRKVFIQLDAEMGKLHKLRVETSNSAATPPIAAF